MCVSSPLERCGGAPPLMDGLLAVHGYIQYAIDLDPDENLTMHKSKSKKKTILIVLRSTKLPPVTTICHPLLSRKFDDNETTSKMSVLFIYIFFSLLLKMADRSME